MKESQLWKCQIKLWFWVPLNCEQLQVQKKQHSSVVPLHSASVWTSSHNPIVMEQTERPKNNVYKDNVVHIWNLELRSVWTPPAFVHFCMCVFLRHCVQNIYRKPSLAEKIITCKHSPLYVLIEGYGGGGQGCGFKKYFYAFVTQSIVHFRLSSD